MSVPETEDSWIFTRVQQNYLGVGKVPSKTLSKQVSKKGSMPPGLESIPDEEDLDFEVDEPPKQVCEECNREDANGWPDRQNHYYCVLCW